MKFKNKIVLVTGGGRGIGAAAVKKYSQEGATVIINYLSDKKSAENLLKEINNNGMIVQANVGIEDDVKRMFKEISEKYGKLDILINSAGIVENVPFSELSLEKWNKTYSINITGTFLCSQKAIKLMKDGGSIINISSIRGILDLGRPPIIDYSTSKAAVISFTKTLAKEVAPNIRVNVIAPGVTNTDMAKAFPKDLLAQFKKEIYLERLIEPEEIADAILFLSSEQASAITGVLLPVDGGKSLS